MDPLTVQREILMVNSFCVNDCVIINGPNGKEEGFIKSIIGMDVTICNISVGGGRYYDFLTSEITHKYLFTREDIYEAISEIYGEVTKTPIITNNKFTVREVRNIFGNLVLEQILFNRNDSSNNY